MSFTTNYSEVNEGGILPVGKYEIVFKYAGETVSKNSGTVYINLVMVIRNDVEQPYKNKFIWDSLFKKKDPSPADKNLGGYSSKRIQMISRAVGFPDGMKFDSLEAWCEALAYRTALVEVEHDNYTGEPKARIKWYNESKYEDCGHKWEGEEEESKAAVTDNDDDVPFN